MTIISGNTLQIEAETPVRCAERYRLTRSFVLRMTGFPVELMEPLAARETAAMTDELLSIKGRLVAEAFALRSSGIELSRSVRRKLKRGGPAEPGDGNAACTELEELNRLFAHETEVRTRALEKYQVEFERARKLLYEFVVSEAFQEVLLLASPELSSFTPANAEPPSLRNSHIRQRELSWISYLQRLTTKNETISFFGPCAWGEFDRKEPKAASIEFAEQHIRERTVYVERWVCEALAELMSADPNVRPLLKLRLADDLVVEGERGISLSSGQTSELSEAEAEFLESCARSARRMTDSPEAASLIERKLLVAAVRVPVTHTPFPALQREVASWPKGAARFRWQESLQEIESWRAAIEVSGDLEARRVALRGMSAALQKRGIDARRQSQALYASRQPINEDCQLGVERMTLGQPIIDQLENDAVPWYEFWRDLAGLYTTRLHESIRAAWISMGGKPVPLPAFWPAILRAWGQLSKLDAEVQRAWQAQMGDRLSARSVTLTEEDTGFLRRNFQFRRMKTGDHLAPDIQIIASDAGGLSDGQWKLLIAEIHPDFTLWQHCFFVWCPDAEAYAKECLPEASAYPGVVAGRYTPHFGSTHTALWVYPHTKQLEFVGVPGPEGTDGLRSAETLVEATEDDVLLLRTDGRVLGSLLHTWTTALNTHRLELRGEGNHSPRLQVGRVIVQRESWTVNFDPSLRQAVQPGGYAAYTALREFRRQHGLPERVFLRGCLSERLTFDKDIKPVFMDFTNPLLMELLGKMVGRFDSIAVTEMLPDIEDCWLENAGRHYSSEFRTVLLGSRDSLRDEFAPRGV